MRMMVPDALFIPHPIALLEGYDSQQAEQYKCVKLLLVLLPLIGFLLCARVLFSQDTD